MTAAAIGGAAPAGVVGELLGNPAAVVERFECQGRATARVLLVTIVVASAAFGAAMGMQRGGPQILFAAVKLPFTLLFTAGISAPALFGLRRAMTGEASFLRDLGLVLCALARGSLVLAALIPVPLFALALGAGYHQVAVLIATCALIAGLVGLALLLQGARARQVVPLLFALVFSLVGAQMGWTLRPWLVRPSKPLVVLRSIDEPLGVFDAVVTSVESAMGRYHRETAP